MTANSSMLFRLFKYIVYGLLTINIFVFGRIEFAAAQVQFPGGVEFATLIEAYAATIDTANWVVLLLMFELETYVLDDHQFTPALRSTLHGIRVFCYTMIIYAFYGYLANLTFINQVVAYPAIADLCDTIGGGWSYAVDLDEYVDITSENCHNIPTAGSFLKFPETLALVDPSGYADIRILAWIDVINSGTWLLLVLSLEADVRLQERGLLNGLALKVSNFSKFVLYPVLLLAAIIWGIRGAFIDFWDAFLWLIAFAFIELNIFKWHQKSAGAAS